MLQARPAVFRDKENQADHHPGGGAARSFKTPGPSRKQAAMSLTGGGLAMTTGLRGGDRLLKRGEGAGGKGKGKDLDFLEPQKLLFKEIIAPPATATKRANLLIDKTNTTKVSYSSSALQQPVQASKSSLAKTPGPKKSVRLAPSTPGAGLKGKLQGARERVDGDEDEAFRTPAPERRARRPPPMLVTPEPEQEPPGEQDEDATRALQIPGLDLESGEVPDLEYAPPSAILEPALDPEDVLDFESLGRLLRGGAPMYLSEGWDGDAGAVIMQEDEDRVWERDASILLGTVADEDDFEDDLILPPAPQTSKPAPTATRRRPGAAVPARARQFASVTRPVASQLTAPRRPPPVARPVPSSAFPNKAQPHQPVGKARGGSCAVAPDDATLGPVRSLTARELRREETRDHLAKEVAEFLQTNYPIDAFESGAGSEEGSFRFEL